MDNVQIAIEELINLSMTKGYLSFDDILYVTDKFVLPIDDVDRVSDRLLSSGVILRENDVHEISDESEEDFSDRSKIDYETIYSQVLELDPCLKYYIDEIRTIPAPQYKEVESLIFQALDGNSYAYNRIIKMYLKVVVRIALWISRKYLLPISDTIQDGNIGLIKAFESFDPNSDARFSTFAPWWIRQSIIREAKTVNPTIYYPVHIKDQLFSVYDLVFEHYCEQCTDNYDCQNLIDEIIKKLSIEREKAIKYLEYIQPHYCVEELLEQEENKFFEYKYDMQKEVEQRQLAMITNEVFATITEREKIVLRLRFGIYDDEEKTLEEIGTIFNVTRERIRQIEAKALRKLRHPSRSKLLKDFL